MKFGFPVATLLIFLCLPSARADGLSRFDADNDGVVTRAECGLPQQIFDRLDQDGNGELSGAELEGGRRRPRQDRDGTVERPDQKGDRSEKLKERIRERLQKHDTDGDGKLSLEEFPKDEEIFLKIDTDGDGFITIEEIEVVAKNRMEKARAKFQKADTDGDGRISSEEFPGDPQMFAKLDQNQDGFITPEEARPPRGEGRKGQEGGGRPDQAPGAQGFEPPHQGGGRGRPEGGRRGTPSADKILARFDIDGDGVVSEDEWDTDRVPFSEVDSDGNGEATVEEIEAARPKDRGQRRSQRR